MVDQIGSRLVDRYIAAKLEERKAGDKRIAELEQVVTPALPGRSSPTLGH